MTKEDLLLIEEWLPKKNLMVTKEQLQSYWSYGEMILEWNQKVNLISRKDEEAVLSKHIFHSLVIAFFHSFKPKEKVLDLGTGGGLPGIPLAIQFPDTYFLLIDSTGKKITACADMISRLKLKNAVAKKSRAEELRGTQFDTIVSRQVAEMKNLTRWVRPLIKPGGELLCLKGGNLEEEIGTALIESADTLSFPETIRTEPIDFLGEKFAEKFVVIAH
ncbi:MAG: 16S rRNA (guanine(527)-N(7))-methyltransferase RsmG [Chloroherpetonaceae bacterium]|nr:16S rRNA (guanine(527)-N(7))-methyltransferase RsmG [Chloroherpetonaceae bacterium]